MNLETLNRIEEGEHYPSVKELDLLLRALNKPLAWAAEETPSVITRRYSQVGATRPTPIEFGLEVIAYDVRHLLDQKVLTGTSRPTFPIPRTHHEAERLAMAVREEAKLTPDQPIEDLTELCQRFGLWEFASPFDGDSKSSPGLMCELTASDRSTQVGIALIDSSKYTFHQRFVLAHELCHWLIGDDFEGEQITPEELESRKNKHQALPIEEACSSFAAHLLLPLQAMNGFRSDVADTKLVRAAIELAAEYGVGWRSTVDLLMNASLVSTSTADRMKRDAASDAEVIERQYALDAFRVPSDYIEQLNKAVEAGSIDPTVALRYSYGVELG